MFALFTFAYVYHHALAYKRKINTLIWLMM